MYNMANICAPLFLLTVLTNFALPASSSFEYCEGTSWLKFQGNCYLFQHSYQQRVSYYDAEDFCRTQGAHLASIHSEEEDRFILGAMKTGNFGGRMWIGFNILAGGDKPYWSDGSPVDYQNKISKEYYANEKCFIMFPSKNGWRPEHCALHYAPICKRAADVTPTAIPPPTTAPPVEGNCPKDWIQFEQKCFKYFGAEEKDRLKFEQARSACLALGKEYDLVSIHSRREQAFLTQHLYDLGTSAWIGIRKVPSDEIGHDLVFGWTDNSRTDFTYWAAGHPPPGTWKYCGRLSYEGVNKGEWIADYCENDKKGYICQGPSDPSLPPQDPKPSKCPADSVGYRESCYRYIPKPDTQENAEATCQKLNGHLVSITDSFEQAFLYNFLALNYGPVWNGLKNIQGSRFLRWSDKQPLYYSNWAVEQPHIEEGTDNCVLMNPSVDLKWNTTLCTAKMPSVCETSDEVVPEVPEVLGTCLPNGLSWIDVGDESCYHVADGPNNVLSWDSTSRYCTARGLKMVKLHSDHQTNALLAYLWNETYPIPLGLIRSPDKKSFMWVDGSPLSYTNWADREPSSWSSDKDCTAFSQSDGKWRPISCSEGGKVVCQTQKSLKRFL